MPYTKNSSRKPMVCGFSPAVNNYSPPTNKVIPRPLAVNNEFNFVFLHLAEEYILPLMINRNSPRFDNLITEEQHLSISNTENNTLPAMSVKATIKHFNQRVLTPRGDSFHYSPIKFMCQAIDESTHLIFFGLDLSNESSKDSLTEDVSKESSSIHGKQLEIETELQIKFGRLAHPFKYKFAIVCYQSKPGLQYVSENDVIKFAQNNNIDFVTNNLTFEDLIAIIAEVAVTEKIELTHQQIQQKPSPLTPRQLTPRTSQIPAPVSMSIITTTPINEILPNKDDVKTLLFQQRALGNEEEWKKTKAAIVSTITEASTIAEKQYLVSQYKEVLQMHYNDNGKEGSAWCRWFNSNEPKSWREVKEYDPSSNSPPESTLQEKSTGSKCIIS